MILSELFVIGILPSVTDGPDPKDCFLLHKLEQQDSCATYHISNPYITDTQYEH